MTNSSPSGKPEDSRPSSKPEDYIGRESEPTPWHVIDQAQIDAFADATLDHQYIHVNPELAKASPFGSTIAHGFLSLSMLSHFVKNFGVELDGVVMGINFGFDKVRFISPVHVGSQIRAHSKVMDVVEKESGRLMIKYEVMIEIRGSEKPAVVAEWLTMLIVE